MSEILTAAQMRSVEAAAIASGQVTGLELMERAGRGVVEAIFAEWPTLRAGSGRAVVLCGPGNNGGDGFVVARLLKEWGWEVEVFLYGTPEGMPPDARVNYERWVGMGGQVGDWAAFGAAIKLHKYDREQRRSMPHLQDCPKAELVVDALFGIGLTRPMGFNDLLGLRFAARMLSVDGKSVCIDLPSGICADSGRVLSDSAYYRPDKSYIPEPADLCVTFYRKKIGHVLAEGAAAVRKLIVVDIGLPSDLYNDRYDWGQEITRARVLASSFRTARWSSGERELGKSVSIFAKSNASNAAHKYGFGHALVVAGPSGRGGAARLAARAALRVGAGLVTMNCPSSALIENAAKLDAVMLRAMDGAEALLDYLANNQVNALCLGPGLGIDLARELVPVALSGTSTHATLRDCRLAPSARLDKPIHLGNEHIFGRGVVLDADALTAYADDPETLFAMLHGRCVLTPHHGEFARLFPDLSAKLAEPPTKGPGYSKLDATRDASRRAGCTVLYKGADTVVASKFGLGAVHSATRDRATPWLATAGAGDVLAGLITGLLARGFHPHAAAETAAWLHVECARSFGPGLIAEDLPEELPKVFRALGV